MANSRSNKSGKKSDKKKPTSPLIADKDDKGRPVGIGGRRRERDIDAYVEGAVRGKKK